MRRIIRHRPSPAMVVALIALLVALAGVAVASIPGPGGVIKACYSKSTGSLRALDSNKSCSRKHERTLSWNQRGPQGLRGLQGTQGDRGSSGAPGATTVVVRYATNTDSAAETDVSCDPGEVATGGGGQVPLGASLGGSRPIPAPFDATTPRPTGWRIFSTMQEPAGNIFAWVLCASP